ncbi:MAG: class I SAM-dependent methyltransferase [Alphaproteobacteria bacterium]
MSEASHAGLIRDQFTRQATVFNTAGTMTNAETLGMIVAAAQAGPDDRVLDIACGGGLVARAFAPHVCEVTGVDVTPAMLDVARRAAAQAGLVNTAWEQHDVAMLPYRDGSFTIVVTRYSFHHLLDPAAVLREMVRVCAPGGRIVVVDGVASEDPVKAAGFNRYHKLRDPSHVRSLTLSELTGLFVAAGLGEPQVTRYELSDELRNLLARSFPNPGDEAEIIDMFKASAIEDRMGVRVRIEGEAIYYASPVAILAARRP